MGYPKTTLRGGRIVQTKALTKKIPIYAKALRYGVLKKKDKGPTWSAARAGRPAVLRITCGACHRRVRILKGRIESHRQKVNGDMKCLFSLRAYPRTRTPLSIMGPPPHITIRQFSQMNRARCEAPNGFKHKLESWSLSDWLVATMGELGEAANIVKKINRVRDGIRGNKETSLELLDALKSELADTYIYLDLTIQCAGMLGDSKNHDTPYTTEQAVLETFHRKSKQIGYKPK